MYIQKAVQRQLISWLPEWMGLTAGEQYSNYGAGAFLQLFSMEGALPETGVQFRVAEVEEDGSLKTEKLLKLIDCHTKLVAVTGMSNAGRFLSRFKENYF